MSMLEWARREVELACKRENPDRKEGEWDYGCACYESALKAYECLLDDKHSGYSMGVTKNILNRLISHMPLTPIEDREEDWVKDESPCPSDQEYESYQHVRRGSLWKNVYPDGRITYRDNDRARFVNILSPNGLWMNGLTNRIIHEMFPITFPYMPDTKPYILYGNEYLTDRKNGDFDTIELVSIERPDGKRTPVKKDRGFRYFKESENGWEEIDRLEAEKRMAMHEARLAKEQEEGI